jgi:hypothetical protein
LISLDKKDRARQSSIWVDGEEYLIHTDFHYWISFGKKLEALTDGFPVDQLTPYFKIIKDGDKEYGLPENWNSAYEELVKFYVNKQPLPKDTGKENKKLIDWDVDSERIYCAFLERYNINLITTDLHWHDFLALYHNLFWTLKDVIGARQYEKPKEMKPKQREAEEDRINSQTRYMWELETEKKETFKMR